ncbi:MEDS domain-containing protein [Saccharothrix sp. S26]|uniref:MEDS domain-containing protein n=1 Tax=Saccharothrix sp. S26 TaxID=2907215 RepID=UPI001F1D1CE4|nr:MEDS domain-containing protein [Saccharothrix sp. S26]MCE6996364.1 MEDS domain-containing protein [Saccharothrix sp. S26]
MERQVGVLAELTRLGQGSHVCCVVDSSPRFEEWAAGCLAEGARQRQKLFRFAPDAVLPELAVDGSVTLADPHVAFLGRGPMDPEAMYRMFRRQDEVARDEGYQGLRLVADMDWLLAAGPGRAEVAEFELVLDEVVRELGATVVCAYRTSGFDDEAVAEVLAVHPVTVGDVPLEPGFRVWSVAPGVWEVAGEVDVFNAEPFERALATAAGRSASLLVRTSGLGFVGLAGAHALARVARARPDLRIVVEDACPSLLQCWALGGFESSAPLVEVRPPNDVDGTVVDWSPGDGGRER